MKSLKALIVSPNNGHLADQYRQMHAKRAFPGHSWKTHFETLRHCVPEIEELRIVDFGCGPNGGLAEFLPDNVISFDPYVERFNKEPWDTDFDVLFSSDVLEHVPQRDVAPFLDNVRKSAPSYVFLNVSTRKAFKTLPDGTNAHITIKPAKWWLSRVGEGLGERFECSYASEDLLRAEVTLCFNRKD